VQKHNDESKSPVPDCHNLFFARLAESIGRLAGEWMAKRESSPNPSQDGIDLAGMPATISVLRPSDSAEVSKAGGQYE
jgi:hypothetical protein